MTLTTNMNTPTELSAIAARLDSAVEEFEDRSCNDYPLQATAENKSIALATLKFIEATGDFEEDWDDFASDVRDADDEIECFDNWLMAYMAHRCKKLATGNGGAALSKAEREVISGLLDLIDELKES